MPEETPEPVIIAQEPEPGPEEPGEPEQEEPEEVLPVEVSSEEATEPATEETEEPVTMPTTETPVTTAADETPDDDGPDETQRRTTKRVTTTRRTTTTKRETTTTTTTEAPSEDAEEPELAINAVRYWGELNIPEGLQHLQVEYTVTANDADEGSLYTSGSVSMVTGSSASVAWSEKNGAGTILADISCAGTGLYPNSVSEWLTEVILRYTINGEEKTKTVSLQGRPDMSNVYMESEAVSASVGPDFVTSAEYRINIFSAASDPHEYSVALKSARIVWYDEYQNPVGSARTIWSGGGNSPFSGPTSGSEGGERYIRYTFRDDAVDVTPTSGEARYFRIEFTADITGGDAYDHAFEISSWDDDYVELP